MTPLPTGIHSNSESNLTMCGIAGYFLPHTGATKPDLAHAALSLAHRGPDGHGLFCENGVGLLHTRLSIIDLAGGAQPLQSHDGRYVLIANGEIYNHIELRKLLDPDHFLCRTDSDCEVILPAYATFGERFPEHLQGMFALALYDRQAQELLLVRDRCGIKPLYLKAGPRGIFFASEIKAILALSGDSPTVNPAGLVQFLQNNFSSGDTTLFTGIERVLPGEMIRINATGIVSRQRYWRPHSNPQLAALDRNSAMDQFDALMQDVMDIHMRSDVPMGLFLSGGVDSSVLLALLASRSHTPVRTYSVGFTDRSVSNELNDASRMAKRYATRHTVLEIDQSSLLGSMPYAVWAADELMGDYANLPVAQLSQRAGQDVKVVFSGEGGDEVFAGYARYRQPIIKYALKALRYPGSGGFRMSKTCNAMLEKSLYSDALHKARHSWAVPFQQSWLRSPHLPDRLSRMQAVDIETWLADDLLVKADRMMMAFGIEGRVPFLDHRVVEFGLGLPAKLKIEGKTGKTFLRYWAERYLPKDHLWSKKRGFTVPVKNALSGELLRKLEPVLLAQPAVRQWFRPEGVSAMFRRQRIRGDVAQPLWRIWQFAIWHHLFIEGNGQAPAFFSCPLAFLQEKA